MKKTSAIQYNKLVHTLLSQMTPTLSASFELLPMDLHSQERHGFVGIYLSFITVNLIDVDFHVFILFCLYYDHI